MKSKTIERALWSVVVFLALLGMTVALRRAFHLRPGSATKPEPFPGAATLDIGFFQHPSLTLLHIIPGLLFMILGPLQFVRRLRTRYLRLHRWSGRVFIAAGLVIGVTALMMSHSMAIGGANETAATILFALFFLFALVKAYRHICRREIALHREWMIRAYAVGLAVATIRPIVGVFFATRSLTHLTPREFFGIAFWLAFTLHLIAAEAWIRYTGIRLPIARPVA